ncbi:FG-GAP repeat domain-containing protein [[Kitasatospora] papulosa]|uniref:FG-GAP repeat domain-containing protein n=1 Tax=[Kitasatospora] papulosa TaxID=1464011 RepID=UPI0039083BA1
MKRTTGDYNGDGIGDVATVYGYDDGQVALWTWLGTATGKFAAPLLSWKVAAGNWNFQRMTVSSGDFNGDGRDDVAAWYDYADGSDTLWTFTSNVQGGFNAPFPSMTRPAGGWSRSKDKPVTGDFNGDGRDDWPSSTDTPTAATRSGPSSRTPRVASATPWAPGTAPPGAPGTDDGPCRRLRRKRQGRHRPLVRLHRRT